MFSLGGSEVLVLAIIALILFGNKNLPENMKKMVKGLNEVKRVTNDAQRSWNEIRTDITRQIMADEAIEEAQKELQAIKSSIESRPQIPGTLAADDGHIAHEPMDSTETSTQAQLHDPTLEAGHNITEQIPAESESQNHNDPVASSVPLDGAVPMDSNNSTKA